MWHASPPLLLLLLLLLLPFLLPGLLSGSAAAAAACTPLARLRRRMPQWVGVVPYSHAVNATWGYPTDCSGFVSWALDTAASSVGHDLKAYEYGSGAYARRIATDELRFGDIITHVWAPFWGKNRCVPHDGTGGDEYDAEEERGVVGRGIHLGGGNPLDYLPGHVFFFDRWEDNATKTDFWAYESTQKADQTPDCLKRGPRFCFNHHVKKKRKKIDKWSHDNCTSTQYGQVTGGAHRLSANILCETLPAIIQQSDVLLHDDDVIS